MSEAVSVSAAGASARLDVAAEVRGASLSCASCGDSLPSDKLTYAPPAPSLWLPLLTLPRSACPSCGMPVGPSKAVSGAAPGQAVTASSELSSDFDPATLAALDDLGSLNLDFGLGTVGATLSDLDFV